MCIRLAKWNLNVYKAMSKTKHQASNKATTQQNEICDFIEKLWLKLCRHFWPYTRWLQAHARKNGLGRSGP